MALWPEAGRRSQTVLIFFAGLRKNFAVCTSSHLPIMIFDIIRQQVETLRRPLAAVVLSTLPRRSSSPMLLLLHWHGFAVGERQRSPPAADGRPARSPVPSEALQLNQNWTQLEQLDQQMLDAAWRYGACNLVREEHRGCLAVGVPSARASRAAATSSGGSTTSC